MGLMRPNDLPNLRELYSAQLGYLLSAENQIVEGLREMIEHVNDILLKRAFLSHLQETVSHVARLERLIADLTNEVDDKKDSILGAIVSSGEKITKETESGPVRDAGLIATAQKIEHYEIASYGTARDWATQLDLPAHANVLQRTLDEEKHADQLLTQISHRANTTAAAA